MKFRVFNTQTNSYDDTIMMNQDGEFCYYYQDQSYKLLEHEYTVEFFTEEKDNIIKDSNKIDIVSED